MSDQIITSLPLIRRYSRHNEAMDIRFRSFVKHGNISNAELDTVARELTDQVWSQVDCLKCANCCKMLEVVVDEDDIGRLSRFFAVSRRRFHELYIGRIEGHLKFLKSAPCVFLGSDNRCQVYEQRPQSCRDYPYLYDKGFRSRSLAMVENLGTCPIVFNVWQRLKAKLWGGEVSKLDKSPPHRRL